jgi:hypothetical protein
VVVCAVVVVCAAMVPAPAEAQSRGVYPLGMSSTSAGVTSSPGLTYSNQFLFYSRDQLKGAEGELVATGRNSVLMDMNTFAWASKAEVLGGARLSLSATLPVANNSLTSDAAGSISGGGGFADSFYQPAILGWQTKRADLRVAYGFLAPTGRFEAGAADNVGSGYWTHVVSSGQTVYLTADKATAISAFEMYEFHGTQEGTDIRPGQTLDLDYSLTRAVPLGDDLSVQLGVVGYSQRQTTATSGPDITGDQAATRYHVNALGLASNVSFPARKVAVGVKYFKEFANRATFQGSSLQIAATLNF